MIRKINPNAAVDYCSAIVNGPRGFYHSVDLPDSPPFNSGAFENGKFNKPNASWGLGAGYAVTGNTPQRVFYNETAGGALGEATLVNKATGVVYISVNATGFNINNSMPLEYNESVSYNNKITQIWAYCPSGNTNIIGQGLYLEWLPVGVNN
jgi:hypothetical protein